MNWIQCGAMVMLAGVALGAFGAHGLKLSDHLKAVYQTGVLYHLVHGLALFAVAWISTLKPSEPLVKYAGLAFLLGVLLFSGSLYALAVTGIKKFGMITPLGGLAFLAGWICLFFAAKS